MYGLCEANVISVLSGSSFIGGLCGSCAMDGLSYPAALEDLVDLATWMILVDQVAWWSWQIHWHWRSWWVQQHGGLSASSSMVGLIGFSCIESLGESSGMDNDVGPSMCGPRESCGIAEPRNIEGFVGPQHH